MAIVVNGYEHRTLAQPLYVNGKQVMEAYANGVKVYPEGIECAVWIQLDMPIEYVEPGTNPLDSGGQRIDRYGFFLTAYGGGEEPEGERQPGIHGIDVPLYRIAYAVYEYAGRLHADLFFTFDGFVQPFDEPRDAKLWKFISDGESIVDQGGASACGTFWYRTATGRNGVVFTSGYAWHIYNVGTDMFPEDLSDTASGTGSSYGVKVFRENGWTDAWITAKLKAVRYVCGFDD